jgi:hypothetical protein
VIDDVERTSDELLDALQGADVVRLHGERAHSWRALPNLPMTLRVNTWPTRSRELTGRLALRSLPASAIVRSIAVDAFDASAYTAPCERQFEERKEAKVMSSG